MRLLSLISLFLLLLPAIAHSQSPELKHYLRVRALLGSRPNNLEASRDRGVTDMVIEATGFVRGTASGGQGGATIMVEVGRDLIMVRSSDLPGFIQMGNVQVRMLINVFRRNSIETPDYLLIAIVNESEIAAWERDNPLKPREVAKAPRPGQPQRQAALPPRTPSKRGNTVIRPGSALASRSYWTQSQTAAYPHYYKFIAAANPRLSADQLDVITSSIIHYCVELNVDARLIVAMVVAELNFNPNATSRVGAMGLGQLMPGTARGLGVTDAYDPEQNLLGAIRLIAGHLRNYGGDTQLTSWRQVELTLAAYNAGPGAVKRFGGIPPYKETQNYVRRVISLFKKLAGLRA